MGPRGSVFCGRLPSRGGRSKTRGFSAGGTATAWLSPTLPQSRGASAESGVPSALLINTPHYTTCWILQSSMHPTAGGPFCQAPKQISIGLHLNALLPSAWLWSLLGTRPSLESCADAPRRSLLMNLSTSSCNWCQRDPPLAADPQASESARARARRGSESDQTVAGGGDAKQ